MALADLVVILAKHEVEFIIVGGMAAVLRGTHVNTFDLDVVYGRISVCPEAIPLSGLIPFSTGKGSAA
jgi:hypothetical protein